MQRTRLNGLELPWESVDDIGLFCGSDCPWWMRGLGSNPGWCVLWDKPKKSIHNKERRCLKLFRKAVRDYPTGSNLIITIDQ